MVLLAIGDSGPSGQDVISRVEADRLLACDIINARARLRKKQNCVMIPVAQFGMIGHSGRLALLLVARENKYELAPMYAPRFPITNKHVLASLFSLMILTTCGPSGNRAHHPAKVAAVFVQLLMFAALQIAWMLNPVVSLDFGWSGHNGRVAQLLVVLAQ